MDPNSVLGLILVLLGMVVVIPLSIPKSFRRPPVFSGSARFLLDDDGRREKHTKQRKWLLILGLVFAVAGLIILGTKVILFLE